MAIRNAGSVSIYTDDTGQQHHVDTVVCRHCQSVMDTATPKFIKGIGFRSTGAEEWRCGRCHKRICGECADKPMCVPVEQMIDEMERAARQNFHSDVERLTRG